MNKTIDTLEILDATTLASVTGGELSGYRDAGLSARDAMRLYDADSYARDMACNMGGTFVIGVSFGDGGLVGVCWNGSPYIGEY